VPEELTTIELPPGTCVEVVYEKGGEVRRSYWCNVGVGRPYATFLREVPEGYRVVARVRITQ